MEDLENIKNWDFDPKPSFYEDDNGKRFFLIGGWRNEALVESYDAKIVDESDYDDLGKKIGAIKKGNYYERYEILSRLRELGYQAVSVTVYEGNGFWEVDQCGDDYRSYEEDRNERILYATKNIDLKTYIKLYNMNESNSFVRILTSDWKISKATPWVIKDSWNDDNDEISSCAIKELNRLGIKIQKTYKKLEWKE